MPGVMSAGRDEGPPLRSQGVMSAGHDESRPYEKHRFLCRRQPWQKLLVLI
jgi:hypothetical protein